LAATTPCAATTARSDPVIGGAGATGEDAKKQNEVLHGSAGVQASFLARQM
jgi:hypothetical protein